MPIKIREFRGYRRLKFTAAEQQAIRNAERGFVYRPGEIAQNRPTPQPPVRQRCAYRHCRYPRTAAYPLLTAYLSLSLIHIFVKISSVVETRSVWYPWDKSAGCLMTERTATGVEGA